MATSLPVLEYYSQEARGAPAHYTAASTTGESLDNSRSWRQHLVGPCCTPRPCCRAVHFASTVCKTHSCQSLRPRARCLRGTSSHPAAVLTSPLFNAFLCHCARRSAGKCQSSVRRPGASQVGQRPCPMSRFCVSLRIIYGVLAGRWRVSVGVLSVFPPGKRLLVLPIYTQQLICVVTRGRETRRRCGW